MHSENNLLSHPVPLLLKELAIPASTGFFFNIMFHATDTWFAGLISTQAVAALSITFPVFFLVIALGAGISTGTTALVGHALGSRNTGEARIYALQAVSFGMIHAIMLGAAGYLSAPLIFRSLGASGEYLLMAVEFMNIMFLGTAFFIGNFVCNAILGASGDTRSFRNALIAAFFLNILLDPLLMFGSTITPALGFSGVAWATLLVQAGIFLYMAAKTVRSPVIAGLQPGLLIPRHRYFAELLRQGFPAMLNTLTVALGLYIITLFASRYGDEPVAAYGIATRIEQLALLPLVGLNMATLTLVAQNAGARRFDRVREVLRTALRWGLLTVICAVVPVYFLAPWLMKLFTNDPGVIGAGAAFLKVDALVLCSYLILYIHVAVLQGLKMPLYAVAIGSFRQVIAPVPVFYLLSATLGMGLAGIWWGIFIVNWAAAIITIGYTRFVLNNLR